MFSKKMNSFKKVFLCLLSTIILVSNYTSCKNGIDGNDGVNGVDGLSIVWLGSFASADEIENPQKLNAYYNTTDGCSYIYDGEKWTLLSKGFVNDDNNSLYIIWLGSFASADEIENPQKLNAYYNTTDGCSYIYDGEKWTLLAKGYTVDSNTKDSNMLLSLPNDTDDTVILTNDKAPVTVLIPSEYQISKVVWKKGNKNDLVDPYEFFSDTDAKQVYINFSNEGTFYVQENGWYNVAAQDTLGRFEISQIEVKTIDKTPLPEVKQLAASTKDRFTTITWNDVTVTDKYNSPMKGAIISYIYNDDETDTSNGEIFVESGIETATITIPRIKTSEDFIRITVKTLDEVGNLSEGIKVQTWCSNQIYATEENFEERLMSMTTSGEIAVVGDCNIDIIRSALMNLYAENPDIMISLDLSEVTGWTSIDSYFFESCFNLNSIILPESLVSINAWAFAKTPITNITIPDSVAIIEESAFQYCEELEDIKLPEQLLYLALSAFNSCHSLGELTIPRGVNRIYIGQCDIFINKNFIFEDTTTIWYKTKSSKFMNGTEVGPMTIELLRALQDDGYYYLYSENYKPE